MGFLSNRIDRESLKAGDHIYSWRAAYLYAHHGIYIGDDKVIHFTTREQKVGSRISSGSSNSHVPCPTCGSQEVGSGVTLSCLNCFLAGGALYRYEYAVNPFRFFLRTRDGTCTILVSDNDDVVVHRAIFLLENGFGCYNLFKNNCEDFAIYCKTGQSMVWQRQLLM